MTDLEKELTRQIHELSKELMALRERVAVLEFRDKDKTPPSIALRVQHQDQYAPPYKVTC